MDIPETLKYAASHEWVGAGPAGTLSIGISAVAADQLGELVYVELPEIGRQVAAGEACAVVESTKAASDVYAPVSGEVVEINPALAEAPGTVNESPYEAGWLFRVKPAGKSEGLLDAAAYRAAAGV